MKNKLMPMIDRFFLLKRGLIESVHNKLKNCCQIEHHRHRSPWNFLVNLISGLLAYAYDPNKPRLGGAAGAAEARKRSGGPFSRGADERSEYARMDEPCSPEGRPTAFRERTRVRARARFS
jgi:hypothetical protein